HLGRSAPGVSIETVWPNKSRGVDSSGRLERVDRAVAAEACRNGEESLANVVGGHGASACCIAGTQGVENLLMLTCRGPRAFGGGQGQIPREGAPQRCDVVNQPGDPAAFVEREVEVTV